MTRCRKLAALCAVAAALAACVEFFPARASAASDEPAEAGSGTGRAAGIADVGDVELQRQINDLRSELLDERERRIGSRLEANGALVLVLGVVIGAGGLWFYARLQAIAAHARIGEEVARGYVPAPPGTLPGTGTSRPPPGERIGPLHLLGAPGPQPDPDTLAMANGNPRASSVTAHRPPAPAREPVSEGPSHPAGPAARTPDEDLERREEAIADCTEAIRLDPRNPALYLERASLRSELDLYEEAVGDYDRAIRLDPDLVAAYHGRCHARSALGLHEEAVEDYDHIVRLDPDAAAALADG